jgi:hypothetical protein
MAAEEVGYFQGTGGAIWPMVLPLSGDYAKQEARQELRRVNGPDDPSPYVETPAEKPLTPKEKLQADAAALGLATDGTVAELTARIDAKVAELREQAKEVDIDDDQLSAVELLAAVDAKLAE